MRKIMLLIAMVAIVGQIGCNAESQTILIQEPPLDSGVKEPLLYTGLIDSGKIRVGNFDPGERAEWPITIHYGPTRVNNYLSSTGNSTTDFAILDKPLYKGSIDYVWDIASSHANDTIFATGYNTETKTLYLDGLDRYTERIFSITYSHALPGEFSIYYKHPSVADPVYTPAPKEAKSWVIIAEPSLILAPFETREVLVVVDLPRGARPSKRWEFQIEVARTSSANDVVKVTTILGSRWLITMSDSYEAP